MSFQGLSQLESSQEIFLSSTMPKVEAPWQQYTVTLLPHEYQNEAGTSRNHMCCLATLTPDAVQWFIGWQPSHAYQYPVSMPNWAPSGIILGNLGIAGHGLGEDLGTGLHLGPTWAAAQISWDLMRASLTQEKKTYFLTSPAHIQFCSSPIFPDFKVSLKENICTMWY